MDIPMEVLYCCMLCVHLIYLYVDAGVHFSCESWLLKTALCWRKQDVCVECMDKMLSMRCSAFQTQTLAMHCKTLYKQRLLCDVLMPPFMLLVQLLHVLVYSSIFIAVALPWRQCDGYKGHKPVRSEAQWGFFPSWWWRMHNCCILQILTCKICGRKPTRSGKFTPPLHLTTSKAMVIGGQEGIL